MAKGMNIVDILTTKRFCYKLKKKSPLLWKHIEVKKIFFYYKILTEHTECFV